VRQALDYVIGISEGSADLPAAETLTFVPFVRRQNAPDTRHH
jgi:hypothetical protein